MNEKAARYVRKGMNRVGGWLFPLSAAIIADLGRIQEERGLAGNVGEIGVFQGKLWLLLNNLARPGEISFAIDVFDNGAMTGHYAGPPYPALFDRNLKRYANKDAGIVLHKGSSLVLSPAAMREKFPDVRLFSIDGDHSAAAVLNDLTLADSVLNDGGIVIMDDIFNETSPDVMVGFCRYMMQNPARLAPVAISPNKVFLSRPAEADFYAKALAQAMARNLRYWTPFLDRSVPFFAERRRTATFGRALVETKLEQPARRLLALLRGH